MADHIWEISRLEVFGVKCFNCDTVIMFTKNKEDIEVVI